MDGLSDDPHVQKAKQRNQQAVDALPGLGLQGRCEAVLLLGPVRAF